jgi:hypothetical protein
MAIEITATIKAKLRIVAKILKMIIYKFDVKDGSVYLLYFIRLKFELFEYIFCSCTSSLPRHDSFGYQAPGLFVQKQNLGFNIVQLLTL